MMYFGLLFDLDGVLVDTAKYHYRAWKELAESLGIDFTLEDNERLKGVSRMHSVEIILEIGGINMSQAEKEACCERKNARYVALISNMGPEELLPGAGQFLYDVRSKGYRTALGSASKNALLILDRLRLTELFDVIVDGTKVSKAKPDPEVFALGGKLLRIDPAHCLVFEDAVAGIQAAHAAGMKAIGIGDPQTLVEADAHLPHGFSNVTIEQIEKILLHSDKDVSAFSM